MDFAALLRQLLRDRGLTQKEFARQVRRSPGFVSDVLHGRHGPSDDLETWADVLALKGEARHQFLLAGGLARSPQIVRDHVARLDKADKRGT